MKMKKFATTTLMTLIIALSIATIISLNKVSSQISYPVPREEAFVMVWADFRVFDSFNPFIPQGVQWGGGWHQLVQEGLYYLDCYTNETKYWLITGFEYNDDYTQFTLHVRQGVRYSDGVPFTSHDIAFSINFGINNSVGVFSGFGDYLDRIETPDDLTCILYLKEPRPRLHLSFFGHSNKNSIIPEHIWSGQDVLTFKNNPPIGTGPYILYNVLPEAGMFIWVRDENWWAKEVFGLSPGPRYVISKYPEDFDIAVPQLIRGDIDYGPAMSGLRVYDTVRAATDDYATSPIMEAGSFGYFINCHPTKYPLNVTEFRRAISYCINKDKIVSLYPEVGGGLPADFYWPKFSYLLPFLDESLVTQYGIRFDPTVAAQMLDDLGFIDRNSDGYRDTPDGNKIAFEITSPPDDAFRVMAIDWADELQKIGIDAVLRQVGPALWWDLVCVGDYDIAAGGIWYGGWGGPDILDILKWCSAEHGWTQILGQPADVEPTYYLNPELDPIVEQLETISPTDPEALPLYHEGLGIIMRDLPAIPVDLPLTTYVMSTKYWTGWPATGGGVHWIADICLHLKSTKVPTTISYITVYITESVAAFTGIDGLSYGPYEEGDAVVLPKEDADRLIAAGQASLVPSQLTDIAAALSELTTRISGLETDISDISSELATLSSSISNITMATYASIAVSVIVLIVAVIILVRKKG